MLYPLSYRGAIMRRHRLGDRETVAEAYPSRLISIRAHEILDESGSEIARSRARPDHVSRERNILANRAPHSPDGSSVGLKHATDNPTSP